jgi:hypothetical protein
MNYLKSYKVFESSHIDSKLTDCLVELFDYGFEADLGGLDITKSTIDTYSKSPESYPDFDIENLLKSIKLVKGFNGLKFSNYLEGDFDKENFGPGDKNPRTREYTIQTMHIEGEILELVDDASNKIINTYIPEASRGLYMINEYSVEYGTCVVVLLHFFK